MSGGFLSKARLKVEHTSKISLGEFKLLGGILSSEKTLLNTHIRSSLDGKKTAAALDEWAQAEGADLAVSCYSTQRMYARTGLTGPISSSTASAAGSRTLAPQPHARALAGYARQSSQAARE